MFESAEGAVQRVAFSAEQWRCQEFATAQGLSF